MTSRNLRLTIVKLKLRHRCDRSHLDIKLMVSVDINFSMCPTQFLSDSGWF